jgi:hypothetical protein
MLENLETGLSLDLKRRTLDEESDVYLTLWGSSTIVGSTPNAPHKVFDKLLEYDEMHNALQRDYYDRIPLWEKWREK